MKLVVTESNDRRAKVGAALSLMNNGSEIVEVHLSGKAVRVYKLLRTECQFGMDDKGTTLYVSGFHEEQDETFTHINLSLR